MDSVHLNQFVRISDTYEDQSARGLEGQVIEIWPDYCEVATTYGICYPTMDEIEDIDEV